MIGNLISLRHSYTSTVTVKVDNFDGQFSHVRITDSILLLNQAQRVRFILIDLIKKTNFSAGKVLSSNATKI